MEDANKHGTVVKKYFEVEVKKTDQGKDEVQSWRPTLPPPLPLTLIQIQLDFVSDFKENDEIQDGGLNVVTIVCHQSHCVFLQCA